MKIRVEFSSIVKVNSFLIPLIELIIIVFAVLNSMFEYGLEPFSINFFSNDSNCFEFKAFNGSSFFDKDLLLGSGKIILKYSCCNFFILRQDEHDPQESLLEGAMQFKKAENSIA